MRKYWYIRFSIVFVCLIFGFSNMNATIINNSSVQQEQVVSTKKAKLTLKEKIALRKIQKHARKSPKSVAGQAGFFDSLLLGVILIVLGALVIIGGIFSISIGGILLGIAGVLIGAIVIVAGTIGIFL